MLFTNRSTSSRIPSVIGTLALLACGSTDEARHAVNGAGGAGVTGQMSAAPGAAGAGGAASGIPGGGGATPSSPGASGAPAEVGSGGTPMSAGGGTPVAGGTGTTGSGGADVGSGGTAGSGGVTGGEGGAASGGAPAQQDYGKGDGSDVITIGDSWMNILTNGGGIEGALDRAGTKYRHYAIAGTTLINGDIPAQYDRAKAANPKIATVIMTGGGNDIMFTGGCATKEACAMSVQRIADALDQLWTRMAADGVTTTVFISYSKNAGTTPADTRPDTAPIPKICTSGKLRCLGVETTDLVARTDTVDGIHPTLPACDAIAKRTLDTMEMHGARR